MGVPDLKLCYFDIEGRAEMIRLALVIGDIPFTDERIAQADWPNVKPSTPYGSCPTIIIDDKEQRAQSTAILRYCGKLTGLYPADPLDALRVDELVQLGDDVVPCLFRYRGDDKEALEKDRRKVVEEDFPKFFGGAEKVVKELGEGPWLVGGQLSIADLAMCALFKQIKSGRLDYVDTASLDKYPRLNAAYDAVMSHPQVVSWYEKKSKQ